MEVLKLTQDLDEITHNVGEYGDAKEQNECTYKSLYVAYWVIITESHS